MTSQPAVDVARAGTEKWHSELLLPKMRGLPDFGFLGSLSLAHGRQEVKSEANTDKIEIYQAMQSGL